MELDALSDVPKNPIITLSGSESYVLNDAVNFPLWGLNIYGKSVQGGGTPTPDAPVDIVSVGDDGNFKVTTCEKNLFEGSQDFSGDWVNASAWVDSDEKYNGLAVKYRTASWKGIGKTFNLELNVPYTMSFYAKTNNGQTLTVMCAIDPEGNCGKGFIATSEWARFSFTFTCTEYSDVFLRVGAQATTDTPLYVCGYQLEKNSAMTEYEPYMGSTAEITTGLPLCSVGDYHDELIYNADGTGKIIKRIRKVVLDGSEPNWTMYATISQKNRPSLNLGVERCIYGDYTMSSPSLILCDKYKSVSYSELISGVEGIGSHHVDGRYLSIYDKNFASSTVDDWKVHLAANPLTVIYVLNTPQEIELSAAEMVELGQLQTFDGTTNIWNDENAEMTIKYLRKGDFMENKEIYYIEESQSWTCPMAGRWKVIAVGGGASGASVKGTATVPGNSTSFGTLITANGGISTADGSSNIRIVSGYGGYNGLTYGGIPGSATHEVQYVGTGNTSAANMSSGGGVPTTALGWGAGGGAVNLSSTNNTLAAGRAGEIRTSIVTIEAGESVPCTVGKGGITEDAGAANGADGVIVIQYLGA